MDTITCSRPSIAFSHNKEYKRTRFSWRVWSKLVGECERVWIAI